MARSKPGLSGISGPTWWHHLIVNDQQMPKRCLENAAVPLEHDPIFANKLCFDIFQMKIFVNGGMPWRPNAIGLWEVEKQDEYEIWRWLERSGIQTDHKLTLHAIATVAYHRCFHPVLDFLGLLVWDGVPRLDTWLVDYLGVQDSPLVRTMAAAWMISGVARVHQPGCKADYALILEGRQSDVRKGKSSALRALGQPWYTDDIDTLGGQEAEQQCVGRLIIELSELDALSRAQISRAKAFISRPVDRFRWKYDLAVREYPRQCIFAGTVNDQHWSRDPTGARRFWPMWCSRIDVDGLERVRDQLWAEARDRYVAGEFWWIDDESLVVEAREVQEIRFVPDAWEEKVKEELDKRLDRYFKLVSRDPNVIKRVHVGLEDLAQILQIELSRRDPKTQIRLAQILQRLRWRKIDIPLDLIPNGSGTNTTPSSRPKRYMPEGYDPKTRTIER